MKEKIGKTSKVLGIIGIVTAFISPIIGATLGIIGLSIKKESYNRDVTLNTIAIVVALISWIAGMFILGVF